MKQVDPSVVAPQDSFDPATTVPDAVAPPEGNPRFPLIDGLRAMAALSVVVFHADQFTAAQNTIVGRLASHLDVGVTVFFVITGFLLYRPFFASAVGDAPTLSPAIFYWRRLVRIVPAYWVALLVLLPILTYAHPEGIPNFLFLQIYRPSWSRTGIPPGWSVCVEMSFYLLLPLYALILRRFCKGVSRNHRRRLELIALACLSVACIAFHVALTHTSISARYLDPLPGTLAWFCVGMGLAVVSVDAGRYTKRFRYFAERWPWACWLLAFVIYLPMLATPKGGIETTNLSLFIGYALIAGLLVAPLVFRGDGQFLPGRILAKRGCKWLGLISYGIYLYHYPIMQQISFSSHSHSLRFLILAVTGAVIAITCGALSYYVIERPALTLKRISRIPRIVVIDR